MIIKIYKTTGGHRQLQRLIEEPEAICVNNVQGRTLITTIPYKKHILADEDECLPPYLARANRKRKDVKFQIYNSSSESGCG